MSITASIAASITAVVKQLGSYCLVVSLGLSPTSVSATTTTSFAYTLSESPASCHVSPREDGGARVDAQQAQRWCTDARHELETALRILDTLPDDDAGSEVVGYLSHLTRALSQSSQADLDLHTLPALTDALRSARETLLNDASTYTRWASLARSIQNDPDAWLLVPTRFIVRAPPAPEPTPLAEDDVSELHVRRAVRAFWGDDVDPYST